MPRPSSCPNCAAPYEDDCSYCGRKHPVEIEVWPAFIRSNEWASMPLERRHRMRPRYAFMADGDGWVRLDYVNYIRVK